MAARPLIQRGWQTECALVESIAALTHPSFVELADLEFRCRDGCIRAHQVIFGQHSTFLKRIFATRQSPELHFVSLRDQAMVADFWGTRKDDLITILLPDFGSKEVELLMHLFYHGQCLVDGSSSDTVPEALNHLCRILSINSFSCKDLKVSMNLEPAIHSLSTNTLPTPSPGLESNLPAKIKQNPQSNPHSVRTVYRKRPRSRDEKSSNPINDRKSSVKKMRKRCHSIIDQSNSSKSGLTDESAKEYACEFCDKVIVFRPLPGGRQFNCRVFLTHALTHFVETQYADVPWLDTLFCPYQNCQKQFSQSRYLFFHLAKNHHEFVFRIDRRLTELRQNRARVEPMPTVTKRDEENKLKRILYFAQHKLGLPLPKDGGLLRDIEKDMLKQFELNAKDSSVVECSLCNRGESKFKLHAFALLHYFTEHVAKGLPGIEALHISPDGSRFMPHYQCAVDSNCNFSTSLRTALVYHLGNKHGFFNKLGVTERIPGVVVNDVKPIVQTAIGNEKISPPSFICCSKTCDYRQMLEHFQTDHGQDQAILVQCGRCKNYLESATPEMFKHEDHVCVDSNLTSKLADAIQTEEVTDVSIAMNRKLTDEFNMTGHFKGIQSEILTSHKVNNLMTNQSLPKVRTTDQNRKQKFRKKNDSKEILAKRDPSMTTKRASVPGSQVEPDGLWEVGSDSGSIICLDLDDDKV